MLKVMQDSSNPNHAQSDESQLSAMPSITWGVKIA